MITFDDGWRDNYLHAFPILKELSVPATVFVVADHVESGREFWPEELTRLLLAWDFGKPNAFEEIENLLGSSPTKTEVVSRQEMLEFANRTIIGLKHRPLRAVWEKLARMKASGFLDHEWESKERTICTWEELQEMVTSGLVTIGSHGKSHAILTSEDVGLCRKELVLSRQDIQNKLGIDTRHFCYPNGSFNKRIEKLVVEAGYESACTCIMGVNRTNTDPYRIRRIPINESRSLDGQGRFSEKKFAFSISGVFQTANRIKNSLKLEPY